MNERPSTTRASHLLMITLILLLAAGTRILGTADRPVWTDEGFMTWITGDLDFDTVLDRAEIWDRHAPLYVFVVGGWREIAGDSRIALRFWAIMSGIVATALVYRMGADALGQQVGRYAALLFAILQMAVYYGQEIRGYGWLIMAVCWMAFFFLRYLRHPRPLWLVGFTLSVTLMLYTVYLGVVILAVMGLVTLVWRGAWRHRLALLGAVLVGVALFTPWLLVILRHHERVQSGVKGAPGTYATTWENLRILGEFVWGEQLALMLALWVLGAW
ncbi:MAG: glycosyltransferase family 39 protein, partial [Anaerolineae bacterium]|nr:glycosyltransferase family 39 protein [Anaerolineae bacterium]